MYKVSQISDERTYVLSSFNHLSQVKANKKLAKDVINMFCTITAVKEYGSSSLIKIQNHQITQDLLLKVLERTLSEQIMFTTDEELTLQPYSDRLKTLDQGLCK